MNYKIFSLIEHPKMFFLFGIFSFFLGIISENFQNLTIIFSCIWIIIFLTIISFEKIFEKIFIFLGIFIFSLSISDNSHNKRFLISEKITEITNNFEEKVTITGQISKKMFQNNFRENYKLIIDTIDTSSTRYSFDSKDKVGIFVEIPKNLTLNSGDKITFTTKLSDIYDDDANIVDFEKFSWLHNIYGKAKLYTFERKNFQEKNFFTKISEDVKKVIFDGFPQKTSALILGITIGNTDLLTSNIKDEFKNASLTHILVVSGANIAFLIMILEFFIKYFPIKKIWQYAIIISFLLLYGTLVGWEVPVIRATIMGIIIYLGIKSGWRINSVNLILAIAVIFSIIEPLSLLYDTSFWLSFWATIGILIFNEKLSKFLKKFLYFWPIVTIFSVTLSATLGSLPALIFHFGSFSFMGIFANILVAGFMGILLFLSSFYIIFANFLWENILYFLGMPIYFLCEIIFTISGFFGKFSLYQISDNIKIPISILLCFLGFLAIAHFQEEKILNSK